VNHSSIHIKSILISRIASKCVHDSFHKLALWDFLVFRANIYEDTFCLFSLLQNGRVDFESEREYNKYDFLANRPIYIQYKLISSARVYIFFAYILQYVLYMKMRSNHPLLQLPSSKPNTQSRTRARFMACLSESNGIFNLCIFSL